MASRTLFRMRSYQLRSHEAMEAGILRFAEMLHRRAGKDRYWLNRTLLCMLKRKGVYFHVLPSLNQARRDVWDNVVRDHYDGVEHAYPMIEAFPKELIAKKDETDMQITLVNGSVWQLMGADTKDAVDRMRGPDPIGIVCSEYAFMRHDPWKVLSPVLLENNGWIAFISTPNQEDDDFDKLVKNAQSDPLWFTQTLTINDTRRDADGEDGSPVITHADIEQLRKENIRPEEIQREYFCNARGYTHGTIYGDLMNRVEADGRITRIPYLNGSPVGVAFDIGHGDKMSIWFYQAIMDRIAFIDYWEGTQKDMKDAVHVMREQKAYMYGRVNLPWDGRSAANYMEAVHFQNVHVAERPESIDAAIEEVRRQFDRFWFDGVRCAIGIEHLKKYSFQWDDVKKTFTKQPVHNQHCHGADALRTGVACGFTPLMFVPGVNYDVKVEMDFDPRMIGLTPDNPWSRR